MCKPGEVCYPTEVRSEARTPWCNHMYMYTAIHVHIYRSEKRKEKDKADGKSKLKKKKKGLGNRIGAVIGSNKSRKWHVQIFTIVCKYLRRMDGGRRRPGRRVSPTTTIYMNSLATYYVAPSWFVHSLYTYVIKYWPPCSLLPRPPHPAKHSGRWIKHLAAPNWLAMMPR